MTNAWTMLADSAIRKAWHRPESTAPIGEALIRIHHVWKGPRRQVYGKNVQAAKNQA